MYKSKIGNSPVFNFKTTEIKEGGEQILRAPAVDHTRYLLLKFL